MNPEELENISLLLDGEAQLRNNLKDCVSDLDKKSRMVVGLCNKVHSTPSSSYPALLDSVRPVLLSCRDTMRELAAIIPKNEFWRWKEMWSIPLSSVIGAAALMEYLSKRTLITFKQVIEVLGIEEEWKDRFTISAEDYLHGVLHFVKVLSRLAVNSVTLGNFEEPIKISFFVKDLTTMFSMLNLKNDSLRRRFDGLKYDVQKIEEVVYDVSLRGLIKNKLS